MAVRRPIAFRLVRVIVRNLDSMIMKTVMATSDNTIEYIKEKLQYKFKIPVASQKLVLRTTELISSSELRRYTGSEQGHELLLHVCDTRYMQVAIHTLSGNTRLLDCVPSLPVKILKLRIMTLDVVDFGLFADMRVSFNSRELDPELVLSDYGIQDQSTI